MKNLIEITHNLENKIWKFHNKNPFFQQMCGVKLSTEYWVHL